MNENLSSSQAEPKIQIAILLLPAEPDWYWQNLAEVPFLLRNALTLQRAGIKKLVIWMQSPTENMDAIHQKLTRTSWVLHQSCVVRLTRRAVILKESRGQQPQTFTPSNNDDS